MEIPHFSVEDQNQGCDYCEIVDQTPSTPSSSNQQEEVLDEDEFLD